MKINVRDEIKIPEPTRQELEDKIKTLEAKVKRLQQSKLDKFAMAVLSSINTLDTNNQDRQITSELIVKQAKSLLAELEKEGEE